MTVYICYYTEVTKVETLLHCLLRETIRFVGQAIVLSLVGSLITLLAIGGCLFLLAIYAIIRTNTGDAIFANLRLLAVFGMAEVLFLKGDK